MSKARPRSQVLITTKISRPSASGNQPPSRNLMAQPATSSASTARKKAVAPMASGAGRRQPSRTTKKVSTVVIIIVSVTAMP
ncbi:hypothetical protein FQZ97_1040770 [compost metagenome]